MIENYIKRYYPLQMSREHFIIPIYSTQFEPLCAVCYVLCEMCCVNVLKILFAWNLIFQCSNSKKGTPLYYLNSYNFDAADVAVVGFIHLFSQKTTFNTKNVCIWFRWSSFWTGIANNNDDEYFEIDIFANWIFKFSLFKNSVIEIQSIEMCIILFERHWKIVP